MARPHGAPVARNGILGPENPKSVTSRSVTWRCLKLKKFKLKYFRGRFASFFAFFYHFSFGIETLIFFSLPFWKTARKTTNKQGLFFLAEPPSPWESRGKRSKMQGSPRERKKKGSPKSKERKIRRVVHVNFVQQCATPTIAEPYRKEFPRPEQESCDPIGQLQVGNEPEIGNGRKMAGEMAGSHFSGKARNGRKNGRANGRTGRKWPNFRYPAIFSAISGLPRKMAAGHFAGHFSAISEFGLISNL